MKKIIILVVCFIAVSAMFSDAGLAPKTGIIGSLHDMNYYVKSKNGQSGNINRVCLYCHLQNSASLADSDYQRSKAPVWNHDIPNTVYTAYQWSSPANQAIAINDPLIGPTRLCMSCHDGRIAVDQHNGTNPSNGTVFLSGAKAVGKGGNLSDDHPVGVDYVSAKMIRNRLADSKAAGSNPELVDESNMFASSVVVSNVAGTYNLVTRSGEKTIRSVLYNNRYLTCATCHDVHNTNNVIQDAPDKGAAPINYFLYAKESNSLICLSCHIK